ncbi:MAG: hypothetical protein RL220_540, partial [Bacteroidota bacterium]
YLLYYKEGDTFSYYECSLTFRNLLATDVTDFFHVYMAPGSWEAKSYFTMQTGEPLWFMFSNDQTRFVMKLIVPFIVLGGGSYLISTVLISIFTYGGLWSLYRVFVSHFPDSTRNLAFGVLFMPSVLCWGSGMLKDSFTLAATCYFMAATNQLITRRGSRFWNILLLIGSGWIVASVKAYILLILLPGTMVWYFYDRIRRIPNRLLRWMAVPLIYTFIISASVLMLNLLGDKLGRFNLQNMFETAAITQKDLKQDYYDGNSFDIGEFEPTPSGVLSKFPPATIAGLYRPFILESQNVAMMLSGLENLFILGLTLYVLVMLRPGAVFRFISDSPIMLYSLIFSILFAFMIGLTTSNFGALVRFKIPLIPLYMGTFMVLYSQIGRPVLRRRQDNLIAG